MKDDEQATGGQRSEAAPRSRNQGAPGSGLPRMPPVMRRYGWGRPNGESREDAISHGSVVQLRAAEGTAETTAATAGDVATAASRVAFTISWTGKFGGDLSAKVEIQRRKRAKDKDNWETLSATSTDDHDLEAGGAKQKLDATLSADRHAVYRIVITPTAAAPHDRYRKTVKEVKVDASETTKSVSIALNVNRWNQHNVSDVWQDVGIDPVKAADTVTIPLFDRKVTVNRLVQPRVEATQALFDALPPETQAEIVDSIAIMGGYAKRTTKTGAFSNHSVGCALDINYNEDTRQNFHFYQKGHREHLLFVQDVVRTDSAHARFDIFKAKGQDQLEASRVFNERFPLLVAELMGTPITENESSGSRLFDLVNPFWYGGEIREHLEARAIMSTVTSKKLEDVLKKTKDSAKKAMLRKVIKYWEFSKGWIDGRFVKDVVDKRKEKLVGMIPLHEKLLQIFLDAGWSWGGDWTSAKDYMHFEDKQAMQAIKLQAGANPGATP